jgi:hypothetical protein
VSILATIISVVLGLAINECSDISPWAAEKVVRFSARLRYGDQDRAEIRAEELAALIKERPGNLLKLITAICFTVAALPAWTQRVIQGLNLDLLVMSPGGVVVLRRATVITTAFATAAVIAMTVDEGLSRLPGVGRSYAEVTDNHLGTDVFGDPRGDAVTSGPASIPFGTRVSVECWMPNESGMGSINAFYLVKTDPWVGEYAPANTFLNADTAGSLDPDVPMCPAS